MKHLKHIIILFLLSSCASSKLWLRTDLYTGELPDKVSEISRSEMIELVGAAKAAANSAGAFGSKKIDLSQKVLELEIKTDSIILQFPSRNIKYPIFNDYRDEMDSLIFALEQYIQSLDSEYQKWLDPEADSSNEIILYNIETISATTRAIVSTNIGSYEDGLFKTAIERIDQISKQKLGPSETTLLLDKLQGVVEAIKVLGSQSQILKKGIDNLITDFNNGDLTSLNGRLKDYSFKEFSKADVSEKDIAELTQTKSLIESQVYRLQDLADPIWKDITDGKTLEKDWERNFGKTRYFAEGNSSVVLVQDDPITYRVQQGSNNPAALIQGQLKIARSLTNATIDIIGARSGLPIGAKDSDGEEIQNDSSEVPVEDQTQIMESNTIRLTAFAKIAPLLERYKAAATVTEREDALKQIKIALETYKIKLTSL